MEKIITIEELKELRDRITNQRLNNDDYNKISQIFPDNDSDKIIQMFPDNNENSNEASAKESSYQLTKTSSQYPSLLDKNAGFSNIIYLATMSLVFEVLFLAISFLIFN